MLRVFFRDVVSPNAVTRGRNYDTTVGKQPEQFTTGNFLEA